MDPPRDTTYKEYRAPAKRKIHSISSTTEGICICTTVKQDKKHCYIKKTLCKGCVSVRKEKNYTRKTHPFYRQLLFFFAVHLLLLQCVPCFGSKRSVLAMKIPEHGLRNSTASILNTRLRRNQRSALHCKPVLQNLAELADYSYIIARKNTRRMHAKRHATRHAFHSNPAAANLLVIYNQVKEISCEIHRNRNVYGRETHKLESTLSSMRSLLKQEMNDLSINYPKYSRVSCSSKKPSSGDAIRRDILNKLYSLNVEFRYLCTG